MLLGFTDRIGNLLDPPDRIQRSRLIRVNTRKPRGAEGASQFAGFGMQPSRDVTAAAPTSSEHKCYRIDVPLISITCVPHVRLREIKTEKVESV